ncbi:protein bli-3 [Circinella umbellata]|nr:protein bli-3 [Circinella umbellata]
MDPPREVNKDSSTVTTEKKIEDLYNLISGIGFCMMTTHCKDTGKLVSRAMSPQTPDAPADLWFYVNENSPKVQDIEADPNVNLAFHKQNTSEWISISGTAQIVRDRNKIKKFYSPDVRPWFGDLHDGIHDGGPDDPRIALILVTADTVHYCLKDTGPTVQTFRIAKSLITGEPPKVSVERTLEQDELKHGRHLREMDDSIVE